jgi:Na+/melibiose symporter-like transporter
MSEPVEPVQQPSGWRKALGCLIGLVGGGLAFVSLLMGICAGGSEGDMGAGYYISTVVVGVLGIAFLYLAVRVRRRP